MNARLEIASGRWAAASFILCAVIAICGCANSRDVMLRCSYDDKIEDVYSLDIKAGSVRLMSVNPPRPGALKATDSHYQLDFVENNPAPGYLRLKVSINRLTSKAEREIGQNITVLHEGTPTELSISMSSGTCVPLKGTAF